MIRTAIKISFVSSVMMLFSACNIISPGPEENITPDVTPTIQEAPPEQPQGPTITVYAEDQIAKVNLADLMGVNIAVYHAEPDCAKAFTGYLKDIKIGLVRIPGGSISDKYYWNGNGVVGPDGTIDQSKFKPFGKQGYWQVDYSAYKPGFVVDNNNWSKATSIRFGTKKMIAVTKKHPTATNLITVNMGTGTSEMAAEWVKWANKTNHYNIKYWELGNELNGSWEAGHITADGTPMTADIYTKRFIKFAKAMKAVDPTIKIGGPACDVEHHDDYFTPLLRDAGKYVDFISFHYYSLRNSLAPENELFDGLKKLEPVMKKLTDMVKKYQPERLGKIDYCISEWNSKLPKDQDSYRLFNGLWFSAWVGEMVKNGVDSATVWDIFSGKDNGHGLLVRHGNDYVPTGRYWGFYLWSHYMKDTMVKSEYKGDGKENLHIFSTRDKENLYVMIMNQSRSESYTAAIDLKDFPISPIGKKVTLSSRSYFWNPYKFEADWNTKPAETVCKVSNGMQIVIPPYCTKVFCFRKAGASDIYGGKITPPVKPGEPELKLLLPESGFCDLPVEGWIRAYKKGTAKPYLKDLGRVTFSVKGPAEIVTPQVALTGAAARFILKPSGKPGKITVTAECDGYETSAIIDFAPVKFKDLVVWNFNNGKIDEPTTSKLTHELKKIDGSDGKALTFTFPQKAKDDHLIDIKQYPQGIPKERIGGVIFDLILPDDLDIAKVSEGETPPAVQAVLQSSGAYWIPCGKVTLDKKKGKYQKVKLEVPDKKFLKVMDRAFSVIFLIEGEQALKGTFGIDNVGFMLRPKKK